MNSSDHPVFDAIIVGSGAGGSAAAYALVKAGKRVLMLEKGGFLPRDGSTQDVATVFVEQRFKAGEPWRDGRDKPLALDEFHNVGGKTKWYGAALLRFSPQEFLAEPDQHYLPWPFGYDELAPFYAQAEQLLHITHFPHEPDLQSIMARIARQTKAWQINSLPMGLAPDILNDPQEARHFDGFASTRGLKWDGQTALLDGLMSSPLFHLREKTPAHGLYADPDDPQRIAGVELADGSRFAAHQVILAAGALNSPRLLQAFLAAHPQVSLPGASLVGANLKMHLNTALMAFSWTKKQDVLRKTALFLNDQFPHSSVQCLGWMDEHLLGTQLPRFVPAWVTRLMGRRAYGFFITTEDGSSTANRVEARQNGAPMLDYQPERAPQALREHRAVILAFKQMLRRIGHVSASRATWPTGTAHALGTLVTGLDPARSVVDPTGKVHGLEGLYVADGSVLARVSRVNPALTIYAWGLRLGDHLAKNASTHRQPAG